MKWMVRDDRSGLTTRMRGRHGKIAALFLTGVLVGCQSPLSPTPLSDETALGKLEFRANGEDFVRQGFVTKDGWNVTFQHVYVTLANLTAATSDGAAQADETTQAIKGSAADKAGALAKLAHASLTVEGVRTVDLVPREGGDETALVESVDAPATHYDALAWSMVPAIAGPAQGQTLQLVGQATKNSRTVDFVLGWDRSHRYVCGDFIGDQRKGIVKSGGHADVEATFHFDHVFGNADEPADDPINLGAVGFEPFAALAADGPSGRDEGERVVLNRPELAAQLAAEDFDALQVAFAGLGHVGEGHCDAEPVEGEQ